MNIEKYEQFEQQVKIFCGKVTEPEIRYTESGKCICTFGIPLKKNKEDDPIWLNCQAWNKRGELIYNNLSKGDEVTVFGHFKENCYKDKNNIDKTRIDFIVQGLL